MEGHKLRRLAFDSGLGAVTLPHLNQICFLERADGPKVPADGETSPQAMLAPTTPRLLRSGLFFLMDSPKASPTRAAATKAYAAATKINTRLASSIPAGDVCVVCLHACGTKACACSHMHDQCAASYVKWSGSPTCKVRPTAVVVDGHARWIATPDGLVGDTALPDADAAGTFGSQFLPPETSTLSTLTLLPTPIPRVATPDGLKSPSATPRGRSARVRSR